MKKRYVYALLFGIPGFFIAGMVSLFAFGASLGFLWLFVFGDDPWPPSAETYLTIFLLFIFCMLWMGAILLGYEIGKRLESTWGWNKNHVLMSVGVTVLLILFIVVQQWSVGNIGPKNDSTLCSEYCTMQGYSGSGMPPQNSGDRTCSCYDDLGIEVITIPLDEITPEASK